MPIIKTINVMTGEVAEREMTPEEVASIPPAPPRNIQAEIDALERREQLPRPVRDYMLEDMENRAAELGAQQGLTREQSVAVLRSKNAGYRRVKELDEQIRALRALL